MAEEMPPVLDSERASELLSLSQGSHRIGLPCLRAEVEVEGRWISVNGHRISASELERAKRENALYAIIEGSLHELQIFSDGYFKLAPTDGYPALEIDGIRMHRTKDMLPEEEAKIKVDLLNLSRGDRVLDICTGLGYSCQEAASRGGRVLTLERNMAVIELARLNPCSRVMFDSMAGNQVGIVICDAARFISLLPSGYFSSIMHDPPTFSLAGDLYSLGFYRNLRRVIAEDGVLLHYTGQPGSRYRRRDLRKGVCERLRQAGFKVRWISKARSVLARPVDTKNGVDRR